MVDRDHEPEECITREYIAALFQKYDVPHSLGILSLDIDGNDVYVLDALLAEYRPVIAIFDFNGCRPTESQRARYAEQIELYLADIRRLNAINDRDRDAVQEALKKLSPTIPTYRSTKFINEHLMKKAITTALSLPENQTQIDKAFVDADGAPRPNGTTTQLQAKAGANIGVGFELTSKNVVVPIRRALSTVTVTAIISDSDKLNYKVLTAFPG